MIRRNVLPASINGEWFRGRLASFFLLEERDLLASFYYPATIGCRLRGRLFPATGGRMFVYPATGLSFYCWIQNYPGTRAWSAAFFTLVTENQAGPEKVKIW